MGLTLTVCSLKRISAELLVQFWEGFDMQKVLFGSVREPVQAMGCVRLELDEILHIPNFWWDPNEAGANHDETSDRFQFSDRRGKRNHLARGFKRHLAEGLKNLSRVRVRSLDEVQEPLPALRLRVLYVRVEMCFTPYAICSTSVRLFQAVTPPQMQFGLERG
jgi:hypothetical protein